MSNNVNERVCLGSNGRQRELITISDDSDEETVTLVPRSPVLVPDDDAAGDDDVSILEVSEQQFFLQGETQPRMSKLGCVLSVHIFLSVCH